MRNISSCDLALFCLAVFEYVKIVVSKQMCSSFLLPHFVNVITNTRSNRICIILKSF